MLENNLDGWLPLDTLGQVLALIFIFGLVVCMVVGVVGCLKLLKRFLDEKVELENTKYLHQIELENKEDENWRKVPSALKKRIKELEKICKDDQKTIALLKLELANKEQFMAQMKVSELYSMWKEEKRESEILLIPVKK